MKWSLLSFLCYGNARYIHAERKDLAGETTGDSFPPHPLSLASKAPDDDYAQMAPATPNARDAPHITPQESPCFPTVQGPSWAGVTTVQDHL